MICWRSSYSTAACSDGISSARPHAALGQAHAPWRERGDLLGGLERAPGSPAVDDVGDEADPQRLLGVDPAPGEHQLVRARGADQAGQQPARAHVAVRDADVDEGRAEHRLGLGVADVAAERQREAEAGGRAVDGRDHRLRQRAQLEDERRHVLLVGRGGRGARRCRRSPAPRRSRAGRGPRRTPRPAPVRTTARQERSAAIARSSSCSASHSSEVIAFSCSGRFSVSRRTCGAGSSTSSSSAIAASYVLLSEGPVAWLGASRAGSGTPASG